MCERIQQQEKEETNMFRKTIFTVAAVATVAAASLASVTTADAKGFKGGWGYRGWGIGALVVGSAIAASNCWQYGYVRGVYTRYWVCD
jgi:hypothetical protein